MSTKAMTARCLSGKASNAWATTASNSLLMTTSSLAGAVGASRSITAAAVSPSRSSTGRRRRFRLTWALRRMVSSQARG